MHRRVLQAIAVSISMCSFAGGLRAQVVQSTYPNPALWQATPDAAALGPVGSGFLGLERTGSDGNWLGSGGLRWGGGMLHASYGQETVFHGLLRDYALGYARRLADRDGGLFGTWGAGVDVAAAYQSGPSWETNARAARVAFPLSVRWGSPSQFSFSPYIAPYAEYGHAAIVGSGLRAGSTQSAGLGFGADFTLWRLGLTIGAMGVPQGLVKYANGQWGTSAALRIRF